MTDKPDSAKLLVVDDDEIFCSVLGDALARRGFDVDVAHNIAEAKVIIDSHRPSYAIVDLRIGEESGLDLVAMLNDPPGETRTVVLTGYASIATAVETIKMGALHYLTKPANVDDIVAAFETDSDTRIGVQPRKNPLSVKRLEWEHIQKVLADHDGNISATARALGMHRRTLQRKLQKHPVRE